MAVVSVMAGFGSGGGGTESESAHSRKSTDFHPKDRLGILVVFHLHYEKRTNCPDPPKSHAFPGYFNLVFLVSANMCAIPICSYKYNSIIVFYIAQQSYPNRYYVVTALLSELNHRCHKSYILRFAILC